MEHNELKSSREENVDDSIQTARTLHFDDANMVQCPRVHEKNPVEGNGDDTLDSFFGMEFESEDQAYELYNEYAAKVGFTIRKEWKNKNKLGVTTRRKFCCSREGQRRLDKRRTNVKKHRDETRVNCMAHIMIALKPNGKFVIENFEATHNHQCTPNKAHLLRSRRLITHAQAAETNLADNVGITPKASAQAGGADNVGFLPIDCNNYLRAKRMKVMEKGDAGDVLQYLQGMVIDDPGSVYAIQLDEDDHITNIFWADSKMVIDYLAFGDVVCFDTTCKANNYDRPFAPFVGVNHHKQIVIFGATLMYDETNESFQWVFKAFLDTMSGKQPTTILTDQDEAMANAISIVLPNTYHRICVWHMHQNALKHLSHIFSRSKAFSEDFSTCVYDYDEEVDFLDAWKVMLEKYKLQENTWLQKLFDEREKWALVYGRNTFCADMQHTQRSEGMNNILKRYLHRSYNLLQFFSHFDRIVSDKRMAEEHADFKMIQSVPILVMDVPILVGARNVYTPEIFKLFQEEYVKGAACTARICSMVDSIMTYKVHWIKKNRDYLVTFDSLQHTVECSCKKFEFRGILCGHALRVIDVFGLTEVPERYILKRWRKDAKVSAVTTMTPTSNDNTSSLARYKVLMRKSMKVNIMAADSSEAFAVAMEGLDTIMTKLVGAFL